MFWDADTENFNTLNGKDSTRNMPQPARSNLSALTSCFPCGHSSNLTSFSQNPGRRNWSCPSPAL
eukprot:1259124-Amphidinium_carterae.2